MPDQSGYYDESASAAPAAPTPEAPAPEEKPDEPATALLPKSFVSGGNPQPGDMCQVEVVRVHGDQVEVKYTGDTEGAAEQSAPTEEPEAMPATAGGGMSDNYS